jgi:RNA polymerase sigma-70 factor (ECF subfamily)
LIHDLPATPVAAPAREGPKPSEREARLRQMVEEHFSMIWRLLRRLGVPEANADDAAQQVFMVGSRRLDEIEQGREGNYLIGIAMRVASEERRTLARRREVPWADLEAEDVSKGADDLLDEERARRVLAAVVDALPPELREAFVLFELEELSAPRVAEILDIPLGTVASRVRRAREHIRENLARRAKR